MKRSKMLNTISDFLEYWYGEDKPIRVANRLLTKIEEAGMTPPFVDQLELDTLDLIGRKWEKEDE